MTTVTELLSESKRKVLYIVYGLVGVGFGATQTAYLTAEVEAPLWLTVAFSVYMYIGVAFGLVAAQNVGAKEVVTPYSDIEALEITEFDGDDVEVYLGAHGELDDADTDTVYDAEPEEYDLTVEEIK